MRGGTRRPNKRGINFEIRCRLTPVTHRHVNRDNGEPDQRCRITPLAALRTVTKSEDETGDEKAEIEVVEDHVGDFNTMEVKRRVFHRFGEDGKCDVIISLDESRSVVLGLEGPEDV